MKYEDLINCVWGKCISQGHISQSNVSIKYNFKQIEFMLIYMVWNKNIVENKYV